MTVISRQVLLFLQHKTSRNHVSAYSFRITQGRVILCRLLGENLKTFCTGYDDDELLYILVKERSNPT